MQNDEISNTNKKSKPWYASSGLALIMTFVSFIIWIPVFSITAGKFLVKPTQLIVTYIYFGVCCHAFKSS